MLCSTRWIVHADELVSIFSNYKAFFELWDNAMAVATDSETKARLIGLNVFFGCTLGDKILRYTDNFSKSLQTVNITAADGKGNALRTAAVLQSLCSTEEFGLFWNTTTVNT